MRRQQRRQIKGRENRQRVPGRKKRITKARDARTGRAADGSEQAGELRVFVQTEGHVDGAGGEEFGGAGRDGLGGPVVQRGVQGVDGVGGEVGAEVEGGDEEEGAGEEEVVGAGEEGGEGGEEGGAQGAPVGCVFDDGAAAELVMWRDG